MASSAGLSGLQKEPCIGVKIFVNAQVSLKLYYWLSDKSVYRFGFNSSEAKMGDHQYMYTSDSINEINS